MKSNLEIFKVSENSVNGGSYRIYARKLKNGSITFSEKHRNKTYLILRIGLINQVECIDFLLKEKVAGKSIHVYGASTKECNTSAF